MKSIREPNGGLSKRITFCGATCECKQSIQYINVCVSEPTSIFFSLSSLLRAALRLVHWPKSFSWSIGSVVGQEITRTIRDKQMRMPYAGV